MILHATGCQEQKRQDYGEWGSYLKATTTIPNISSICGKPFIWSHLPWEFDILDMLNNESYYLNYAQKDFEHRLVTYILVSFPYQQGKDSCPWGIAWTSRKTAEGIAYGFISMLPSGWVPNDPFDFFRLFLDTLHQQWKATCFDANGRVKVLVSLLNHSNE